jgi:hypothetical protein
MKKIHRELRKEFPFAVIEPMRGGHFRILLPNGRFVIAASPPSCPFFLRNVRSDVRRQMGRRSNHKAE